MRHEGLHQTVAAIARSRPGAPALTGPRGTTTYAELDRAADALAAGLVTAGVAPGDLVPVVLPRSPELVTALLAVLKTGAAYAALDPGWPPARRREVIGQLGAPLVLDEAHVAAPAAPGYRPARVRGTDACSVFFTSGTTGSPKGVVTTHRATARLFGRDSFARFTSETTMPLAAPVPWDAFSLELWSVLLNGGTSVIVDEPYLSAGALRAGISAHGVNTAWLTSSLFNMIVDEDLDAFAGLTQLMIGGERLSTAHVARFLARHPDVLLLNGYGPVESVVFATTHRITPVDCARPGGIPLGTAVPGTRVTVLASPGEEGEICVAGDGLAIGYLGRPELTEEKFPTSAGTGERVYRTGDLGVLDADGLLHFRGRADRQVKIRGHRIEPAEVEAGVLALLPVRSCHVLARRDDTGAATALVAFCVPVRDGDRLTGARDVLTEVLASHLCPAAVVSVAEFPVTGTGKLDEKALLALVPPGPSTADGPGPSTPDEPVLAAVLAAMAEVLGTRTVDPAATFTELGGDSLAAGRVCARLAARLGRPVPVSRLYQHPTAAALAEWLHSPPPAAEGPAEASEVPLTPMQLVYLTKHLTTPDDLTSHCLLTWVVEGGLDRAALAGAVAAVHERHEALRAAYVADPRPVARLDDLGPPELEDLPPEESTESAIRTLRAMFSDELCLAEGEVWRTALVPAGDAVVFGCLVHHIAFDGWSEAVLADDLATAYRGLPLPPAPAMSEVHRAGLTRLASADPVAHHENLRADLTGVPALTWPDGLSGGEPDSIGETAIPLSRTVVAAVDEQAAKAGVTRFTVLLGEWAATLAEVTGQDDFAVGVPVAQRDGAGLADVIGCHLTMLSLRMRDGVWHDPREVGEVITRALRAQDVPFTEVVRITGAGRTARPPVFQTLFALQDNRVPELRLDGARTTFVRQPYLGLPLELHAELWPAADGSLLLTVHHQRRAVADTTAHDLAKRYAERLRTIPSGVRS
ncbi:amino acid adenylation protein [Lentzea aerocolonigenes]|uniref:Amino acid adenylation protein n=1 Tax=Lentzea aerocolonigenes TaxID=68170 RepID=A0A0F0GQH0_LENAE|nr:AMP-binding protein [Lentzea aerocolonigenes]KJK43668.1 amino acid adenylation protein [Lentzea aerocolonigenes]